MGTKVFTHHPEHMAIQGGFDGQQIELHITSFGEEAGGGEEVDYDVMPDHLLDNWIERLEAGEEMSPTPTGTKHLMKELRARRQAEARNSDAPELHIIKLDVLDVQMMHRAFTELLRGGQRVR